MGQPHAAKTRDSPDPSFAEQRRQPQSESPSSSESPFPSSSDWGRSAISSRRWIVSASPRVGKQDQGVSASAGCRTSLPIARLSRGRLKRRPSRIAPAGVPVRGTRRHATNVLSGLLTGGLLVRVQPGEPSAHPVLDGVRHDDPRVHARLVDRPPWRREAGIGEGADRDGDESRRRVELEEDSGAALGAERERSRLAVVRDPRVVRVPALDPHILLDEPRLGAEHASGPALAGETVADRDANRLAVDLEPKLAAATSGLPG